MGGGAFEHLHRGRSSGDNFGCLWVLVIVALVIAVMLATVGRNSTRLNELEREKTNSKEK